MLFCLSTKIDLNGTFSTKVIDLYSLKIGQILCAHKPGFLMLGHICKAMYASYVQCIHMCLLAVIVVSAGE